MTNKKKYLQQQNEKYPKGCFGNKQWNLASENSVISCNRKSKMKVARRAMHQG